MSSYFLEKTTEPGGGGDQLNDRIFRPIPESVPYIVRNVDKISGTGRDPIRLAVLVAQHVNFPRKNGESLDSRVAVDRHRNARRNRSFDDARSLIVRLRRNYEFNFRSEYLECFTIAFN